MIWKTRRVGVGVNARGMPGRMRDAPAKGEPSPRRMRVAGGGDDRARGREDGERGRSRVMENCVIGVLRRTRAVRGRRAGVGRRGRVRSWTPTTRAARSRPDGCGFAGGGSSRGRRRRGGDVGRWWRCAERSLMIFSARCAVGVDAATRRSREAMREVWLSKPYSRSRRGSINLLGFFRH